MNKYLIKSMFFFSGIILTVFILELSLSFRVIKPPIMDNNGWWKWNWHTTHNKFESKFTQHPDDFDKNLGWVPKKNFSTVTEFGKLTINSIGIRSDKEYSLKKDTGRKRIVTIGDSFTYGECVADNETYSAYLESLIPGFEVMNFGVHGYGLDQELLRLNRALVFGPDTIIVGIYNPDIGRINLSFRDYFKPQYYLKNGKIALKKSELPPPQQYSRHFHFFILDLVEMLISETVKSINPSAYSSGEIALASAILEEMSRKSHENNAEIYLVYLPSEDEVKTNRSTPHVAYNLACKKGIAKCIDPTDSLHSFIRGIPEPGRLFNCHYAKEIHESIAREIKKQIFKDE